MSIQRATAIWVLVIILGALVSLRLADKEEYDRAIVGLTAEQIVQLEHLQQDFEVLNTGDFINWRTVSGAFDAQGKRMETYVTYLVKSVEPDRKRAYIVGQDLSTGRYIEWMHWTEKRQLFDSIVGIVRSGTPAYDQTATHSDPPLGVQHAGGFEALLTH